MPTQSKRPTDHETLGRTFVDAAWNDSDYDQIERLCSPTFVVHDSANPTAGIGLDAYAQFVSRVTDRATHVNVAVDHVIVADGKVAIRSSGTLRGAVQGREPDGAAEETSVSAFEVIHIEDDRIVEWAGTMLPDRTLKEFRAGFAGDVICPGDAQYDEARALWNGMIDRYPGLILQCSGVADVIDAVNLVREHDLLVSVRGGGHNVAGSAVCNGGVVIDLSAMNGVWVDPDERTAWVQAGATLGDVDRETQAFGLATPLGVVSATGVAGLTLGGGLGHLRRKYGLSADNLASVDIVTPDGEYLTASADENQSLFWGLRGGGGGFGVVTGFEFDLHPVGPEVAALVVVYHTNERPTVIRPGESDSFDWGGFGVDWKIDGADTEERFAIVHHTPFDPGVLAAPLHYHHNEDEYSYVLEGTMGALLGDEVVEAEAGSWVYKPREQWHTFWNPDDTPCHVIEVISPAGFEEYFREVTDAEDDVERWSAINEKYSLEMDFDSVPDLCERFGLTYPE